jgi:alpha-aspartyl dipeptidase. Serine peptidase. MEROPS family S51
MTDARNRLFLVSSSTIHGRGYLDHVADALASFLSGVKTVTFVPYALADRDGTPRRRASASERSGSSS